MTSHTQAPTKTSESVVNHVSMILSFLLLFVVIVVFIEVLFISLETPSDGQIRSDCARHGGVRSIASPSLLTIPILVCRDGYARWVN